MGFSIEFLPGNMGGHHTALDVRMGVIVIGEFSERFEAPLSFWSADDYRAQWKKALERTARGASKSCLITSMYDPQTANFLFWWPLYRQGRVVFVQNQLLLLEQIDGVFDPADPYKWVPDRKVTSETGERISEWNTTIGDIRRFLKDLRPVG